MLRRNNKSMPTFLCLAIPLLLVLFPLSSYADLSTNLSSAYNLKSQGQYQEAAGIFEIDSHPVLIPERWVARLGKAG